MFILFLFFFNYCSSFFSNRISTEIEIQDALIENQNSNLNSLEKTLKNQSKQFMDIDKLNKSDKEKKDLEFKDQQMINDFIKKQEAQDELMKSFSEKIKDRPISYFIMISSLFFSS